MKRPIIDILLSHWHAGEIFRATRDICSQLWLGGGGGSLKDSLLQSRSAGEKFDRSADWRNVSILPSPTARCSFVIFTVLPHVVAYRIANVSLRSESANEPMRGKARNVVSR